MRGLLTALVYTAVLASANPAAAEDAGALRAAATGEMEKLVFADPPAAVPEAVFLDAADAPVAFGDYRGRWVLLNFWATWCAPCREEMPALDRLQAALGGDRFAVVPVATGRNAVEGIRRFYGDAAIGGLPILRDPKQDFARAMGVLGLPVTVLIDPEGREVARLVGPAEWDGPDALALLSAATGAAPAATD